MTTKPTAAEKLDARIEAIIKDKFDHYLADISFRIGQMYDLLDRAGNGAIGGKVYAEDLNLKGVALLTGFAVTNNSPTAGSIAWSDLHVVYNGTDHEITNGNTALQYVYFTSATTPTTLKSSATKPVLTEGDVLLFVNEGGVARNMLSDTNGSMPRVVATNAIDTDAIAANAVTGTQILAGSVGAGKLGTGAINNANLFAGKVITGANFVDKTVGSTQLGDNSVQSLQLASGAINNTNKFSGKVINGSNMVDNTVNTTQLAPSAVDGTILKAGAINNTDKFSGQVIQGANMVAGTVGTTQLGTGAVSAAKLNILRHVMY